MRERQAFDFAIVSVAAVVTLKGGVVSDARIVFGGVAPIPWRASKAEAALKGKTVQAGMDGACKAAVEGAEPLSGNGYKVKAVQGILEEALTSLT